MMIMIIMIILVIMKLDTNFLYTFFVQKNISLFIQILLYVERKLAVHFVTGYCSYIQHKPFIGKSFGLFIS